MKRFALLGQSQRKTRLPVTPRLPTGAFGWAFLGLLGYWLTATNSAANDAGWASEPRRLGLLKPASQLIGRVVTDRKDRPIGKIQDLLLDVPSGRALVTLISSGKDSQMIPVPAESYTFVSTLKLVVGAEKNMFQSAPRLSNLALTLGVKTRELEASFAYFHEKISSTDQAETRLGSAASMLGAQLVGKDNAPLGQVKDIMIDLQRGRVVYFVVQAAGNSDAETELYVIPAAAVQLEYVRGLLVLDTERTHFLAGPRFSNEFWTDMAFSDLAKAVYRHYGLGEAGQTEPSPKAAAAVALDDVAEKGTRSASRSDAQITQAVLEEIMQPSNGFVNLDIVVRTVRGRVTLEGIVKNEKQRKQLIAAAERVAGAGNVEDQLNTHGKIKAAQL